MKPAHLRNYATIQKDVADTGQELQLTFTESDFGDLPWMLVPV